MNAMQVVMVHSEAGGVDKTTTAVSVAMCAAEGNEGRPGDEKHHAIEAYAPRRVVLIDLDPRSASTKWLRAQPVGEGLHVGAIIGAKDDPTGWAEDLAVPSGWHPNLRIIPASTDLSNRESENADYAELRLKAALTDLEADLVVIDCANRQGGPLTLSALHAADTLLHAARLNDSGMDGVAGSQRTIAAFRRNMAAMGAVARIDVAGAAVTRTGHGFLSISESDALDDVRSRVPVIEPIVPYLSIVPEARGQGEWYGKFRKGQPVRDAYAAISGKVIR